MLEWKNLQLYVLPNVYEAENLLPDPFPVFVYDINI